MNVPVWCADLVARFWATAGTPPPFPRDLRESVVWFPFVVVELPRLRLAAVCDWLSDRGCRAPAEETDRPLRGCLFADFGHAYAFLDADDDRDERRFSLAHELGHYLRDYWYPRETVKARLGTTALEVLDGVRPPTSWERLHAMLRNTAVGPFSHLLRRDESGCPLTFAEREAETAADRLAFELLAPTSAIAGCANRNELTQKLVCEFGFPKEPAEQYAAILVPDTHTSGAIVARLRGI